MLAGRLVLAKAGSAVALAVRSHANHLCMNALGQASAEQARSLSQQLAVSVLHAARCYSGAAASTSAQGEPYLLSLGCSVMCSVFQRAKPLLQAHTDLLRLCHLPAACTGAAAATSGGTAVAAAATLASAPHAFAKLALRDRLQVFKQLSKFRLSALVVSTTAAGFVMGEPAAALLEPEEFCGTQPTALQRFHNLRCSEPAGLVRAHVVLRGCLTFLKQVAHVALGHTRLPSALALHLCRITDA